MISRISDSSGLRFMAEENFDVPVKRVLIVEAEDDERKMVGLLLKHSGYDVFEAADGKQAITALQECPDDCPMDAIICNPHLPKVHGHKAIAYIRAIFPEVPVIVITAQPSVHGAAHFFKQGVVDYLTKPAQPQTLLDAIKRAIAEQAGLG